MAFGSLKERVNDSMFQKEAALCANLIHQAQSMVVLSGAGISTNAGIPDFRGPQGLYVSRRYNPEEVFGYEAFLQNPRPFYQFACDFISLLDDIKPTYTHYFLAALEKVGKIKGVITQNIDFLHQQAGSMNVIGVHGSIQDSFCLNCKKHFSLKEMKGLITTSEVARCECGGLIKPDVVFFGEAVKSLEKAFEFAQLSDLFLVVGTSCVVYPAAMIPQYAGGDIVIVNQGECHLETENVVLQVDAEADTFFSMVAKQLHKNGIPLSLEGENGKDYH